MALSVHVWLLCLVVAAYGDIAPYYEYDVCYPRTECTRGYFLPHTTQCEKYRVCNGAGWVVMPCGYGLKYDYTLTPNVCRPNGKCWSDDNDCADHTPPPTVTPPECFVNETCLCPGVTDDCTGYMTLPHRYDCTVFYLCVHNTLVLMPCSAGLYFNVETGNCTDVDPDFHCMDMCPHPTTVAPASTTASAPASTTPLPTRPPVFPTQGVPPAGSSLSLLVLVVLAGVSGGVLIAVLTITLYKRNTCIRNQKVAPSSYIAT